MTLRQPLFVSTLSVLLLLLTAQCGGSSEKKPLTDLFVGDAPSFPPQTAKLTIGVLEADAKTLIPEILGAQYQELKLPKYGDRVNVSVSFMEAGSDGTWLRRVKMSIPTKAGLAALQEKWGPPKTIEEEGSHGEGMQKHHFWFNPAASLRAVLRPHAGYADMSILEIGEYLALEQLVGTKGQGLGVEKISIVGATVESLKAAYPNRFSTREQEAISGGVMIVGRLELPPIGVDSHEELLSIQFEDKVATGYEVQMGVFDTASTATALAALLEKCFGAPKTAKLYSDTKVYSADFGLSVQQKSDSVTVQVGAKARLETR